MEKNIVSLYNIYATIIALFCYPKPRARLSKTDGRVFYYLQQSVYFKSFNRMLITLKNVNN